MNTHRNKSNTVVIPRKDYEALIQKAEAYDDLMAVSSIKQAIARGEEELIPQEIERAKQIGSTTQNS